MGSGSGKVIIVIKCLCMFAAVAAEHSTTAVTMTTTIAIQNVWNVRAYVHHRHYDCGWCGGKLQFNESTETKAENSTHGKLSMRGIVSFGTLSFCRMWLMGMKSHVNKPHRYRSVETKDDFLLASMYHRSRSPASRPFNCGKLHNYDSTGNMNLEIIGGFYCRIRRRLHWK